MNSYILDIEKQGLNSLFEEVFDLMTTGTITATKCKAVMCNIIDEDKDEPETELEVFVEGWLRTVNKHCCSDEGAKA
ncbi:hypothetical protein FRZ06_04160 [Anoxybacterium hadale]|uniref:Uncharacterized protein n=1 Tax=Anoxybacterium hadale TaxID=3408580 RepID=A0ACD1A8F2_9FIRM|nr:hypothetical protein FRZ06_04160 [Clostridiales bacterium]